MTSAREIRAAYDEEGLYVYQAYRPEIDLHALAARSQLPPVPGERVYEVPSAIRRRLGM